MKTMTRPVLLAGLLTAMLASCNKKEHNGDTTGPQAKENIQYVTYSDQASTEMEMAFDEGLQNAENGTMTPMNGVVLGPCVTVTLAQTGNLKTLTIDFGPQGCLCYDGKTRKGKLVATSANFNAINVLRTLTTENYYVNDYQVAGTITRNITRDLSEHSREAQIVENLEITAPNNVVTYTRTATLTRIFEYNMPGPVDNTLTTWGQVNISRPNGNQVSRVVGQASPLLYKNACHQVVSGIANITTNGNNYTIDFGNGSCDDIATVSNGSSTWIINL